MPSLGKKEQTKDNERKRKLNEAKTLEETEKILKGHEDIDPERVYQEINKGFSLRFSRSRKPLANMNQKKSHHSRQGSR